ncbi:hypothetical protein CH92_19965 [Stutzerimonas stutzeri]|uniref:Uncharacterized protein n=1 Tax=Stutzerimonas stutzeri TaxID=316 RepID=W8RZV9_STUST|nr:hypothetical protein CH92_19965 [Stutzerimonas stutzeri]
MTSGDNNGDAVQTNSATLLRALACMRDVISQCGIAMPRNRSAQQFDGYQAGNGNRIDRVTMARMPWVGLLIQPREHLPRNGALLRAGH